MSNYLPKLETMLLVGTLGQTLRFFAHDRLQLSVMLTISAVALIILKIVLIIRERYENHKIFDRGNVPSVGNKNPFSGNLFEIIKPRDNLRIMLNYHKKLGKNFGIFYGQDPWVLSTDLDLLYKVFSLDSHKFVNRTNLRLPITKELDKSVGQNQGDDWRRARKMLSPSFAHKQMKSDNVYKDIEKTCDKLVDYIDGHPIDVMGQWEKMGREIDVVYGARKYSLDILFKVAFGHENGINFQAGSKDDILNAFEKFLHSLNGPGSFISIMFSPLRHYP